MTVEPFGPLIVVLETPIVGRLKSSSLVVGDELDRQSRVLDAVHSDVDKVNAGLNKAMARSDKLIRG